MNVVLRRFLDGLEEDDLRRYRVYQVDSFTNQKFTGNPAGVVPNADGLSDKEMQCIARELNNSETAFILRPDAADHDVRIRYFTPTTEVPSCGHATIAAHYVRAVENHLGNSTVMQKIGIGILPVEIIDTGTDYSIVMTQGPAEFFDILAAQERDLLLLALGLTDDDIDERCPIQIVSTGHSKVMIGIKSRDKLNAIRPNLEALRALSKQIGCNGYYVFTFDAESDDILVHGRMFAPAIGISEDPVTGNANGPLGAYLIQHEIVHADSAFIFKAKQGEAIERSGIVSVNVSILGEGKLQVKVEGQAVIVFQSELILD